MGKTTEIINFEEEIKEHILHEYSCPNCKNTFKSHIEFEYCPICRYISNNEIERFNSEDIELIELRSTKIRLKRNDMSYSTYNLNYVLMYNLLFELKKYLVQSDISFDYYLKMAKEISIMQIFEYELCSIKNLYHGFWFDDYSADIRLLPFDQLHITLNCPLTIKALKKMNPDLINYMEEE